MYQHGGHTFGLQALEHALHARSLAGQSRFGQLEHIEARHIQHRAFDLRLGQFTLGVEQGELLNLLVGGEQVALDLVGKEAQAALTGFARLDALTLVGHALGDPGGQGGALDRLKRQADARALQGLKPGAAFGGLVQSGQADQGEHIGAVGGALGQLLQSGAAFFARLARRNAHLDQLAVAKQAHGRAAGQHLGPVKMRARHREHGALGEALGAGAGADGVGRLLHQQGLVTMQHIQAAQTFFQVGAELGGRDLHQQRVKGWSTRPCGARFGRPSLCPCCCKAFALLGPWTRPGFRCS